MPQTDTEAQQALVPFLLLRWFLVVSQAVTVGLTWDIWQARSEPPMLPMIDLPAIDMGIWVLGSLAVVLVEPRIGIAFHAVVLGLAMLADQARIQPQVISHVLLLCGTLAPLGMLARAHVVAVWFYAGLSKLLSSGFAEGTAHELLKGLWPEAGRGAAFWFAVLIWGSEMLVPVFVLPLRTRKAAAVAGIGMHAFILLLLSPLCLKYNSSVWPWNVSLAAASYVFFFQWEEQWLPEFLKAPAVMKAALVVLLVSPIGHYFGVVDAYLAHSLYSDHVPMAVIRSADGSQRNVAFEYYKKTNAFPPPEHRIYDAYFERAAKPGDVMTVTDPRWWYRNESPRVVK